jgi:hypothetical protein
MILQSCEYAPPKYGLKFNETREKIGLPILSENWEHLKEFGETGSSSWINPNYDKEKPYYFRKTVIFNKDTIIWESDWYIGQQKFNTIDGTFNEELYITYHFIKNKYHNFGWECVLSTAIKSDNDYYHIENISITKEKADSILVSWGLGNNKF